MTDEWSAFVFVPATIGYFKIIFSDFRFPVTSLVVHVKLLFTSSKVFEFKYQ